MNLLSNPLLDALGDSQSIILAGAGGGFDIYSGLPLYFALRESAAAIAGTPMRFHAGHGLTVRNLAPIVALPGRRR